jgi:hypothetical protein
MVEDVCFIQAGRHSISGSLLKKLRSCHRYSEKSKIGVKAPASRGKNPAAHRTPCKKHAEAGFQARKQLHPRKLEEKQDA